MEKSAAEISKKLHEILNGGKIFTVENKSEIPVVSGVYVAFEEGETYNGTDLKRVVRVGESENVKRRIGYHFKGNPENTVFAKKVAEALKKANRDMTVADYMKTFSFAIIEMPNADEEERKAMEENLITTFASDPNFKPSENWLGKFLDNGMWLSQGFFGEALSDTEVEKIEERSFKG